MFYHEDVDSSMSETVREDRARAYYQSDAYDGTTSFEQYEANIKSYNEHMEWTREEIEAQQKAEAFAEEKAQRVSLDDLPF